MTEHAVGFSGRIASGKTSLASELAKSLGCPVASFGEYVRYIAMDRGLETERGVLQEIGESLINTGIPSLCESVLAHASWTPAKSIVIEGIRHMGVLAALRDLLQPLDLIHIHLSVGDRAQRERLKSRNSNARGIDRKVEKHSTEIEVLSVLPDIADVVIDGTQPIGESLHLINDVLVSRA